MGLIIIMYQKFTYPTCTFMVDKQLNKLMYFYTDKKDYLMEK